MMQQHELVQYKADKLYEIATALQKKLSFLTRRDIQDMIKTQVFIVTNDKRIYSKWIDVCEKFNVSINGTKNFDFSDPKKYLVSFLDIKNFYSGTYITKESELDGNSDVDVSENNIFLVNFFDEKVASSLCHYYIACSLSKAKNELKRLEEDEGRLRKEIFKKTFVLQRDKLCNGEKEISFFISNLTDSKLKVQIGEFFYSSNIEMDLVKDRNSYYFKIIGSNLELHKKFYFGGEEIVAVEYEQPANYKDMGGYLDEIVKKFNDKLNFRLIDKRLNK